MSKGKTFESGALEKAGFSQGEDLKKSINDLEDSLKKILGQRFKNSSDSEAQIKKWAQKYSEALSKGGLDAAKVRAAYENKTLKQYQKEKLKEDLANQKVKANLDLATAAKFGDKLEAAGSFMNASLKEASIAFKDNLKKAILNTGSKSVEEYASIFSKYSASINARLQAGADNDNKLFKNLINQVKSNLSTSPFLKQSDMIDNLNELVQLGINYNIEQRAFLESMTDKIVTTFDAFDSNLLNLIRLQQSDSTAARMGMEASLTKSFNAMFRDTSYLSNTYDAVSQALYESISQLGRDEGLAYEYVVQKWLGSLGSVGVGNDTLTRIATALNALGTGNIEALAGDTAMQNLLTKAANLSGQSYTGILTKGLNAETANKLLKGIVDYVREISVTDNQVVRQQFGQLFGVSMSDMVAALNLNTDQLNTVYSAMMDFESSVKETQNQLNQVGNRMHMSEMINNVFENIMATTGANIANNTGSYMLWKALNIVEDLTGGISIPTTGVLGSFVDLESTVTQLVKSGMIGLSLISTLVGSLNNLNDLGGINLNTWGGEEYLSRGTGFGGVTSGYKKTTSNTVMVSSSGSDMVNYQITAAKDEATEEMKSTKANAEETATEKMLKAIMVAVTGTSNPDEVKSEGVKVNIANSNEDLRVFVTNQSITAYSTSL